MRRTLVALAGCALFAGPLAPPPLLAAPQASPAQAPLTVDVLSKGSSSLLGIRKAKSAVPVARMHPTSQQAVRGVLKDLSIYRQLPDIRCEADPRVVTFFLDNPEVAVGIWRALGVSDVTMKRTGQNTFHADDGHGSYGDLSVVYRDAGQQVLYCDGTFLNPVSKKPIRARAVIHFRHRAERGRDGRAFDRHDATMFVSLPSNTVEAVARAISPVSNRLADRNFEEVSLFIRMMSVAMTNRPDWVGSLSARLSTVGEEQRRGLSHLAATLHQESGPTRTRPDRPPIRTAGEGQMVR